MADSLSSLLIQLAYPSACSLLIWNARSFCVLLSSRFMIPDNVRVVERFALHADCDPGEPFRELASIPLVCPVALEEGTF